MRWQVLRQYGLSTEDLTVTFDHVTHDAEFQVNYGRKIRREEDGFYHVTPLEWESFRGMQGVALIDGAEWKGENSPEVNAGEGLADAAGKPSPSRGIRSSSSPSSPMHCAFALAEWVVFDEGNAARDNRLVDVVHAVG